MDVNNTKLRKSLKLLLISTFIVSVVYYLCVDVFRREIKIIDPNIKYILQWTDPDTEPFRFMGKGQSTFLKHHCPYNNCFVTSDRTYLNKLSDFSAILFHGPELNRQYIALPGERSMLQKYVFVSMESSHYYPIIDKRYDRFFNWTWTYKLDSDLYYGYIIIRDKDGDIIGPKIDMHWLKVEEMKPIDEEFKNELSHKKIAAAWFVSNCPTPSKREGFVKLLQRELAKYNMTVDIYGKCGTHKCPKTDVTHCSNLVKKQYYFYLSFENSFSEDYVTEKLLTALVNNAVPIVYGGANYTRFMPDGAYLDARKLGVEKLAQQMVYIINNKEKYYDFFKWKNHYSYHYVEEATETNYYCNLCRRMNQNDSDIVKPNRKKRFYRYFRKWWNPNNFNRPNSTTIVST